MTEILKSFLMIFPEWLAAILVMVQRFLVDCPVQPVRGVAAQHRNNVCFLLRACTRAELLLCGRG